MLSLLGQNNILRIAECGQGVLKRFGDFEYGGFYSKVNTEILHTAAERLCEFRENRSCTFRAITTTVTRLSAPSRVNRLNEL